MNVAVIELRFNSVVLDILGKSLLKFVSVVRLKMNVNVSSLSETKCN